MRSHVSRRGFTLVELLVSMSLAMVVMAAVFSTYLYLGRNLTRLSYRSVMESQSRKILTILSADIRNAKSVVSASVAMLVLTVYNQDPSKGPVPLEKITYAYDSTTKKLTRVTSNPDGSAPSSPVTLNNDIGDANVQVPVSLLPDFSFLYYTANNGDPVSQFSPPPPAPMSIKQVAISFTLQAGDFAVQGQQGTLSSYQVASSPMPLVNRPLPDGS